MSCHIAIGSRVGEGAGGCYARAVSAPPAHGLTQLRNALRQFAAERDWDQFHSPKNLASALNVEAAELLAVFQWLTEAESRQLSPEQLTRAREEMADVRHGSSICVLDMCPRDASSTVRFCAPRIRYLILAKHRTDSAWVGKKECKSAK